MKQMDILNDGKTDLQFLFNLLLLPFNFINITYTLSDAISDNSQKYV